MKDRDDGRTSATSVPGDYEHETKKSPVQIRVERVREAKRAAAAAAAAPLRFFEALYRQKLRQVILRTRFVTSAVAASFRDARGPASPSDAADSFVQYLRIVSWKFAPSRALQELFIP